MKKSQEPFLLQNQDNLIQYLYQFSDITFQEKNFNELDALLFAELSYFPLENLFPKGEEFKAITIQELTSAFLSSLDAFNLKNTHAKPDMVSMVVALKIGGSKRYKNLMIEAFDESFSKEDESQFAALQLSLDEDTFLVSFRGTDASLTGWKEDFNLCYQDSVLGQRKSFSFLKDAVKRNKNKKFYAVGHSKGGNFASYSLSLLEKEEQDRLINAYLFDSPGLNSTIFNSEGHERVKDKLLHYVPESTSIGAMFNFEKHTAIIKCVEKSDFATQHYYSSWLVKDGEFVKVEDRNPLSYWMEASFSTFLKSIPIENRKKIVDLIFQVLDKMKLSSLEYVMDAPISFIFKFLRQSRKESKEDQKLLREGLKIFISSFRKNIHVYNKYQKLGKEKRKVAKDIELKGAEA